MAGGPRDPEEVAQELEDHEKMVDDAYPEQEQPDTDFPTENMDPDEDTPFGTGD